MASSIDIAGGTTPILHSDGYYKRTDAIAALFPGCNPKMTWQAARNRNRNRRFPLPELVMVKFRPRGSPVDVDGITPAQIAQLARFVAIDPLEYFEAQENVDTMLALSNDSNAVYLARDELLSIMGRYYKRTDAIALLIPGCNPATTWQAARKRNRRRETPLPLLAMIKIRSRGSLVNVDGIALAQIAELARFVVTDPLQYFTTQENIDTLLELSNNSNAVYRVRDEVLAEQAAKEADAARLRSRSPRRPSPQEPEPTLSWQSDLRVARRELPIVRSEFNTLLQVEKMAGPLRSTTRTQMKEWLKAPPARLKDLAKAARQRSRDALERRLVDLVSETPLGSRV
jgi:hypothetical protein